MEQVIRQYIGQRCAAGKSVYGDSVIHDGKDNARPYRRPVVGCVGVGIITGNPRKIRIVPCGGYCGCDRQRGGCAAEHIPHFPDPGCVVVGSDKRTVADVNKT